MLFGRCFITSIRSGNPHESYPLGSPLVKLDQSTRACLLLLLLLSHSSNAATGINYMPFFVNWATADMTRELWALQRTHTYKEGFCSSKANSFIWACLHTYKKGIPSSKAKSVAERAMVSHSFFVNWATADMTWELWIFKGFIWACLDKYKEGFHSRKANWLLKGGDGWLDSS